MFLLCLSHLFPRFSNLHSSFSYIHLSRGCGEEGGGGAVEANPVRGSCLSRYPLVLLLLYGLTTEDRPITTYPILVYLVSLPPLPPYQAIICELRGLGTCLATRFGNTAASVPHSWLHTKGARHGTQNAFLKAYEPEGSHWEPWGIPGTSLDHNCS